jgi:D-alanyl-D-alanine carboxypeptidase (penicillin-binding protein 5/6)
VTGKTGFVKESLNCAVSYGTDNDGKGYICCTGYAHGGWKAIFDHVNLYTKYFDPSIYVEPEPVVNADDTAAAGDD